MALENLKEMILFNEAGSGFFSEAKQYSDSGEFSEEFYELFAQVTRMKKVMKHPKWLDYLEAQDRVHDSGVELSGRDAIRAITDLEDALTDIDREFDRLKRPSRRDAQQQQSEAE